MNKPEYPCHIIRSKRKTVSLSVNRDLSLTVRAPLHMTRQAIDVFIRRCSTWIKRQEKRIAETPPQRILSGAEIGELFKQANRVIPGRVAYYAELMGVSPIKVSITRARKRWGSCNSAGRLCFSFRIMLLPPESQDYIVAHELAHLREMNHSARFYDLIERIMPDFRDRINDIKSAEPHLPT